MASRSIIKILIHYKSFLAGLLILAFFIGLSVYAAVTWPYDEARRMWNDPSYWVEYPEYAAPAWIQRFTGKKEIEGSLVIDTTAIDRRHISRFREVMERTIIENVYATILYNYDVFPRSGRLEISPVVSKDSTSVLKIGINVIWSKPSGINITLFRGVIAREGITHPIYRMPGQEHPIVREYRRILREVYNVSLNVDLEPIEILFIDDKAFIESNQTNIKILKGAYRIMYSYFVVEGLKSVEIRLIFRGTVFGLLGTDAYGRDLFMGIAWGAPLALLFGLLASVLTTMLTMVLSAISAWFKGAADVVTSRINEIFMILPFLPTLILIMLFYGFTIWTLLIIVVILNTLGGSGLKMQRAMFLQIREMPYIEAARAYGASSFRIIFIYMIPRVMPILIPNIVVSVPSFVFLEAALAMLGIADPTSITWGKILEEAYSKAALFGRAYHWILAPAVALILLSIAFALIGFTLDRVFNPRLRQL